MPISSLVQNWSRTCTVVAIAVLTSACASTGAVPRPFPTSGRPPIPPPIATPTRLADTTPAPSRITIDTLTADALALLGRPYRSGGIDPSGFDCSGFTQYVFGQRGIALPREVREQFALGQTVKADDIAAGDLIFFSTVARGPSHVAIALDADQFIHAPNSSGVVRVEHLSSTYWSRRLIGVRRML